LQKKTLFVEATGYGLSLRRWIERAVVLTERDEYRVSVKYGVTPDTSGGKVHWTTVNVPRTPRKERCNTNSSKHGGENNEQLVNIYGDGRVDGGHFSRRRVRRALGRVRVRRRRTVLRVHEVRRTLQITRAERLPTRVPHRVR